MTTSLLATIFGGAVLCTACSRSSNVGTTSSQRADGGGDVDAKNGADTVDPPQGQSVYFAQAEIGGALRFYFDRTGDELTGLYVGVARRQSAPTFFRVELLGGHRARLKTSSGNDKEAAIDVLFGDGRSLSGSADVAGRPNPIVGAAPVPLASTERAFDAAYAGWIGDGRWLRVRLSVADGKVSGASRRTSTTTESMLAGTLDAATRRVLLTESDAAGTVTGRLEALLVTEHVLAGRWRSPDGKASYPIHLWSGGPYPETRVVDGDVRVMAQESFRATNDRRCEQSILYPELVGIANTNIAQRLNGEMKRRVHTPFMTWDDDDFPLVEVDKQMRASLPDNDCHAISAQQVSFSAFPLTKKLVGFHFKRTMQVGESKGLNISTCWVADLDTGTLLDLAKELGDEGRRRLGELADASARPDAGTPEALVAGLTHRQVRETTPLCVEAGGVQLADEVVNVTTPTIAYRDVAPLFKPGKLRSAFSR